MATALQAFLIEAAKIDGTKEVHLRGRLAEQVFVIRGLTLGEWNQARKRAVNANESGADRIDGVELTKQTIIAGCVEPNFKDAEFVQSCGCMTPSELIDRVLLAGEASQLANEIMSASGFGEDIEKAREEAKNS